MNEGSNSTDRWGYIDFELSIRSHDGGDSYNTVSAIDPAALTRSPSENPRRVDQPTGERERHAGKFVVTASSTAGHAQAEMRFPFDEEAQLEELGYLENVLLHSSETYRRVSSQAEEQIVKDVGQKLFQALFIGDVAKLYAVSLDRAKQQEKNLRLNLHIQPPELGILPWEFLYDPGPGDYLSLSSRTPLVRYLHVLQPIDQLNVIPPLRILGVVVSPRDLAPLNVENEKRRVEEAIKFRCAEGLVELVWLDGISWRDLQRAMRNGEWHVFHFIGHGGLDPGSGEGAIALADDEGYKHLLRGQVLARLLDDHNTLRLVFLNSCEGARGSQREAFSSIAATLIRRGIPAVVAMQYEITDRSAIEFARTFYESVAEGLPVDTAVTQARVAVSTESMLEWGTPVLHMRSTDGRIFDISTSTLPVKSTQERQDQQDLVDRYREYVELVWTAKELDERQAERLKDFADNRLKLSPSIAADIEHEVMGGTIEAVLERQKQATREKYRREVAEVWVGGELNKRQAEWLKDFADNRLKLSPSIAADIEHEVMGGTIEAVLERQKQATREKYRRAPAKHYDSVVVGAGQAGVPLALSLAQAGYKTALIEREHVGGTCINEGCVPSKTMVASAKIAYFDRRSAAYGVRNGHVSVDMIKVRQRKRDIVEALRRGNELRVQSTENLDLLMGEASFTGPKELQVQLNVGETVRLTTDVIFLNVGARSSKPPIEGLDTIPTLDSTSVMELDEVPEHLLVVGGGYIGLEFAQLFRRFGSEVTVVQRGPQLLSREDADVAEAVAEVLRQDGIDVLLSTEILRAGRDSDAVQLQLRTLEGERSLEGSHLLVTLGRIPNTDLLNLDAAGVESDRRGFVRVNERLETNVPGIYALGDVKGGPALTHIAYDDFRIVRTNLLEGGDATIANRMVPYTVFIDPELGRAGLSEQEARERGLNIRVAKVPMAYVVRALELEESRGFMKAVVDADTGQILGCAVLGIEGGEIAAMIQIAMMSKAPYTTLRDAVFSHQTLAESLNTLFAGLEE